MENVKPSKLKLKRFVPYLWIFIISFIASFLYKFFDMSFLDEAIPSIKNASLDNFFLGLVAFLYAFSAFITIIGLLLPSKWAAKITMVGNEEDLVDYKRMMWGASFYMLALGIGLFILLFSGEAGYFSPSIGFAAVTLAYALTFIISYKEWSHYDEILRKALIDASHTCVLIIFTISWFWCAAAWIGWISAPSPLGLLAMVNWAYIISVSLSYQRLGLFGLGKPTSND